MKNKCLYNRIINLTKHFVFTYQQIFFMTSGNELFGEMKNRLKLRSIGHSDTKESPSEMLTNNAVEQQEPSSHDNTSSSMSANSSPRSSIYDDFEQSDSKTVSDILLVSCLLSIGDLQVSTCNPKLCKLQLRNHFSPNFLSRKFF
ncbi:unnamed protein product [Schistosoma bovis]|nr:unnamed protein product [Schistosoma bovis]